MFPPHRRPGVRPAVENESHRLLSQEVVHARSRCKNRPLGDVVVQGLRGQPLTGTGLLELCYLGLETGLQLNQRTRYRRS